MSSPIDPYQEFEYVLVESGCSPTVENNLLENPVLLSTGEANYTNDFLLDTNSTQIYLKLEDVGTD